MARAPEPFDTRGPNDYPVWTTNQLRGRVLTFGVFMFVMGVILTLFYLKYRGIIVIEKSPL